VNRLCKVQDPVIGVDATLLAVSVRFLLDDRQGQVGELDGLLHQGVRPHHHEAGRQPEQIVAGRGFGQSGERGPALGVRQRSREQRDPVAERLEQPCQRHGMLAGQQVRGRKKRPLSARVRHEGQRQGGHGGLPRPYVSLEQPHHRPPPPQIDCDRGHCRDLVRGKARGLRVADASSDLFGQGNLDRADRLARTVAVLRKDVERYLRQISDDAATRELLALERDDLRRNLDAAIRQAADASREVERRQVALRTLEKEVIRLRAARGEGRPTEKS